MPRFSTERNYNASPIVISRAQLDPSPSFNTDPELNFKVPVKTSPSSLSAGTARPASTES